MKAKARPDWERELVGGEWGKDIILPAINRQNFIDEISRGDVESVEKEILIYVRLLVLIRAGGNKICCSSLSQIFAILTHISALRGGEV